MSTRTRIVMVFSQEFGGCRVHGSLAVQQLIHYTMPRIYNKHLPEFQGLSKKGRLLKLAEKLPPGFSLILVQEPKRTRKARSLYWSYRLRKGGVV